VSTNIFIRKTTRQVIPTKMISILTLHVYNNLYQDFGLYP